MKTYYYTGFNQHTEHGHHNLIRRPQAYSIAPNGTMYFKFSVGGDYSIHQLNAQLELTNQIETTIAEVNLSEVINPRRMFSTYISSTPTNKLILGLSGDSNVQIYYMLDEKGEILNKYPKEGLLKYVPNKNYLINFYPQANGQVILVYDGNWNGCIIGVTQNSITSFLEVEHFDSNYLNDTINFIEKFFIPAGLNLDDRNSSASLGTLFKKREEDYYKDPNRGEFIKHLSYPRIQDVVELDKDRIMISLYTNAVNKSNQPDKNTPYYFMIMDKKTGAILKEIELPDRSIYKKIFKSKIVKYQADKLLFKTHDNVYVFDSNLEIIETIALTRSQAKFKRMGIIGRSEERIYFQDAVNGVILNFPFDGNLLEDINELIKDYKAILKTESIK